MISRYFTGRRSAKAIYGIILITAALLGLRDHDVSPVSVAGETFIAALIIVIAEIYAEILGKHIEKKRKLSRQERGDIISEAMTIASVSLYPSVIFLISTTGLYSVSAAFHISLALSVVALGVFSYLGAKAAGSPPLKSCLDAITFSAVGVFIIFVKYLIWH